MKLLFLIPCLILCQVSYGKQYKMIEVGTANRLLEGISIETVQCQQKALQGNNHNIANIIANDFSFYVHLFNVLAKNDQEVQAQPDQSYMQKLLKQRVYYIITVNCDDKKLGESIVSLFSTKEQKKLVQLNVAMEGPNFRKLVHQVSDNFYRRITGRESFFSSRIVFVSDQDSTSEKTIKELYIMDFDGYNIEKLTSHRGIVLSPAVSADNRKVLYSLIPESKIGIKNINLYEVDIATKQTVEISSRKGINSGAIYAGDGKGIYLTLSEKGNANIYYMDIKTKQLRAVTNHYSADVDPSLSLNKNLLTFLSGRSGKANVYTLDPRGTEKSVKRISYVGKFNATPRFSRDGSEIVFVSWLENSFDLFRINADGQSLVRLTKDFGSNEEPTFSPDGDFIAFTSQKPLGANKVDQNVYLMNREGKILGALTKSAKRCFSPRFTN